MMNALIWLLGVVGIVLLILGAGSDPQNMASIYLGAALWVPLGGKLAWQYITR